jgi:alpha-galactosidase
MYVTPQKDRAVFFAYSLDKNLSGDATAFLNHRVKMQGLDAKKNYKLVEINKEVKQRPGFSADNKVLTGEFLMNAGLPLNMGKAYQSVVIEITEVK